MTDQRGSLLWRAEARRGVLTFAKRSRLESGFGWLSDEGTIDSCRPPELWINARMTYVFSLAFLAGEGDCTEFAAHGVEALSTLFHDDDDNGWSAEGFFERAVSDGVRDGLPGICYTPDWAGKPVVAERFQWVMAEAILAADALAKATGEERYRGFADRWWQEVNTHFADPHDRQLASRIVTDNGGV